MFIQNHFDTTLISILSFLQKKPFSAEKGSPIDLDLGPPIDKKHAENYRIIKKVILLAFCTCILQIVLVDLM